METIGDIIGCSKEDIEEVDNFILEEYRKFVNDDNRKELTNSEILTEGMNTFKDEGKRRYLCYAIGVLAGGMLDQVSKGK